MSMHAFAATVCRSALVAKEIMIKDEGEERVRIVARPRGFVAFFLTILGIDTTTTVQLFTDRVVYSEGTFSGQLKACIPISAISCASGGFFKPVIQLLIGSALAILGLGICISGEAWGTIFLVIGAALIAFYFFSKTLVLSITAHSGQGPLLLIKRSVMDNVDVDYTSALKIIDIMNDLVRNQSSK